MAHVATVKDLLESLDFGKTTAETDVLDALRQRFAVPPRGNLAKALQSHAPGDVLAAILDLLKPFALMIVDIYAFLADAAVRTEGNLEVHVPLSDVEKLRLDLKHFRRVEQAAIGAILRSEFDPGLLPPSGQWRLFHDGYWPPNCGVEGFPVHPMPCPVCPKETLAEEFKRFKRYFELLDRIAVEQLAMPERDRFQSPGRMDWDSIHRRWDECKKRQPRALNTCAMEKEWVQKFFRSALGEFDSATRSITIGDLRQFLALPYWKQRWQFYEVWFLMLILRSYGLPNLVLRTAGQDWILAVGSVDPEPIAVGQLASGGCVEFYYQYQGIPPAALFPTAQDRPEVLVQQKNASGKLVTTLLVAEAKARRNFGTQEMKGALFPLQEWNPEAIVGANYFSIRSGQRLNLLSRDGTEIVAADECAPRSQAAQEHSEWLAAFWRRKIGAFVSVVLIDTSGSMPGHLLPKAIDHLRGQLKRAPTTDTLIATFSGSTSFFPPAAFDDGTLSLRPEGGTALAGAVKDCQRKLSEDFPGAGQLSVHVVTDLDVGSPEIEELIQWASSENTAVRIYTWPTEKVKNLVMLHPNLTSLIDYLPN